MKILIVEDELIAQQKLEDMLLQLNPETQIMARLESVEETVTWLKKNPAPDIAFFDIQLADATCFEIFDRFHVAFPVIFLTAYDNYVMQAFDHNAIHYILKPATVGKVKDALDKVQNFRDHFIHIGIRNMIRDSSTKQNFPERIIVRKGLDAVPLEITEIAYFFSEHKISFAKTHQDTTYMVDDSLADLEQSLNPAHFFRANRQYLVHIKAIQNFRSTKSSKIQLEVNPNSGEPILVSKENAANFRQWIKGV